MVKKSASNSGELGSIPGSRRSLGEENGNTLQYARLENPMDRGAWRLQSTGSQRVRHNWATIYFQILFISMTEQLFPDIVHYI